MSISLPLKFVVALKPGIEYDITKSYVSFPSATNVGQFHHKSAIIASFSNGLYPLLKGN